MAAALLRISTNAVLWVWGQVPDQDERHAAIGRHFLKEHLEGIKSAGRCAKADYQR
jgi:hypothetical protein